MLVRSQISVTATSLFKVNLGKGCVVIIVELPVCRLSVGSSRLVIFIPISTSFLPSSSLMELCEAESHYLTQTLLKLTILLPQPLNARILGCIISYTWLIVVFKYLIR